jgi:hypothetical protein
MKSVFVIWKNIEDGMWHPVAKLTRSDSGYSLNYTKGASHVSFIPFPRMKDLTKIYHSSSLFSFFSNRLIPVNRPEFRKMLAWSSIDIEKYDELDLLGIAGGERKTDEFRIIPEPEITALGEYKVKFFISGINYLDEKQKNRIERLDIGEKLRLIYEDDNPHDGNAIIVSTKDNVSIGYCPKYFNCDLRTLLRNPELCDHSLTVVKVNNDAPNQFKVLCEFTTKWPKNFMPLVSKEYLANTTTKI